MSAFPRLKTGAVAQYPLDRTVRYQTESVWFMDGSKQRFRLNGNGLRRWKIRLDLLDETELAAVMSFAEQQGSGVFSFTDPVTGDQATSCIISNQSFRIGAAAEMNGNVDIEIEETA